MRFRLSAPALIAPAVLLAGSMGSPALAQNGGNQGVDIANQILRAIGNGIQQSSGYPRPQPLPPQGGGNLGGIKPGVHSYPSYAVPNINGSNVNGLGPMNMPGGGFNDAFGTRPQYQPQFQPQYQQPQYQPQYQQPQYQQSQYQTPYQPQYQPQYQASTSAPASSGPVAGERYYVPSQYAGSSAGSVITYGQYRYKVGSDGTMVLYTGSTSTSSSKPKSGPPTPGERYKIPVNYLDAPPGKRINYFGYAYLTNNDGTMTALDASESFTDTFQEDNTPEGPVPGKRYRVPDEHAGAAPGSVVTYGGYRYVVNDNGTMTSLAE